jgi:hypothetical protein
MPTALTPIPSLTCHFRMPAPPPRPTPPRPTPPATDAAATDAAGDSRAVRPRRRQGGPAHRAAARLHPHGVGRALPTLLMLGDHTAHHLDIALALGRGANLDHEVANAVLHVETAIPNPFVPARARSKALRLTTVDTGWSHGSLGDPQVEAPAEALISTLAGRTGAFEKLAGRGAQALRLRCAP